MGKRDSAAAVIRPASTDDAASIARLHATSWRETYGRFVDDPDTNPWFEIDRRIGMWSSNLEDQTFTTVVAIAEVGMIGFATVQTTAEEPAAVRPEELSMLYVLEHAHGSGTGQALLDVVLGQRPASLWVAADNPRAHSFYRRNGFMPDGAISSFGPIGTTVRLVR
ncbi:GNAT family N-acetyltransferase [Curtobacterium sp. MCBD17_030]|uniref:GNAT family N-acetyltransferase n=1 Tax=Curtobacterium sp. MCBD17_030 TaxID=2175649 RepID=UPI000D900D5C|nr:GNAT family N-acetyltransferase [Curtobacterium sp. MCBD17_030]PYY34007.1 GNAT family N-acetyltransferase [Curtobacterium sp. MCBD17_030]